MKNNKSVKKSTIKEVLHYVRSYKLLLALSILFSTVSVALTLYIPIVIGDAIDMIVGKDAVLLDVVGDLLIKAGIIAVIIGIAQWLINNINNKITYNVIKDVRDEAFEKIETLPLK